MIRFLTTTLVAVALMGAVTPANAQGNTWREIAWWIPPSGEARISPHSRCAALRALTGYDLSVISAAMVPGTQDAPPFCRVVGLIQPEVKFEVALPPSWHKRLLMIGNGGYAGRP